MELITLCRFFIFQENIPKPKKKIKLARELSDLVTYCKSVAFHDFLQSAENRKLKLIVKYVILTFGGLPLLTCRSNYTAIIFDYDTKCFDLLLEIIYYYYCTYWIAVHHSQTWFTHSHRLPQTKCFHFSSIDCYTGN